jgi:hypothetical protein
MWGHEVFYVGSQAEFLANVPNTIGSCCAKMRLAARPGAWEGGKENYVLFKKCFPRSIWGKTVYFQGGNLN